MDIKPIRTVHDHERALEEIEKLWDAAPGTREADRLEVLATLAADYEARHEPIEPPDPIEAIRFRMEQGEMSRTELAEALGGANRASEVLSRKRRLNVRMIRALHERFGIPASVLIGDYDTERAVS